MNRARVSLLTAFLALLLSSPAAAQSQRRGLDVEVWTDRGNDAVYQPGDGIEVRVRASDDAFLLLYEIDGQGNVRVLHPERGSRGWVNGRETYRVPSDQSEMELVVEGPVGQGFIVALVSREPFQELPWYLRPFDAHAEGVGYEGGPGEEEGVSREGRIVGDPYVAMERIRREVLADPEDEASFASAYTSYYVHHEVRYPRYLCNDCHRPNRWAWWDGFDPYYTNCSVFDFRVNWGWGWGPGYWHGFVPYYYYVYRADCPPRYRVYASHGGHYSSWDGWGRWNTLWGGNLRRYKSDPPAGYKPPTKFDRDERRGERLPPGFLADRGVDRGRRGGTISRDRSREGSSGGFRPRGDGVRVRDSHRGALPDGRRVRDSGREAPRVERGRTGRDFGRMIRPEAPRTREPGGWRRAAPERPSERRPERPSERRPERPSERRPERPSERRPETQRVSPGEGRHRISIDRGPREGRYEAPPPRVDRTWPGQALRPDRSFERAREAPPARHDPPPRAEAPRAETPRKHEPPPARETRTPGPEWGRKRGH